MHRNDQGCLGANTTAIDYTEEPPRCLARHCGQHGTRCNCNTNRNAITAWSMSRRKRRTTAAGSGGRYNHGASLMLSVVQLHNQKSRVGVARPALGVRGW